MNLYTNKRPLMDALKLAAKAGGMAELKARGQSLILTNQSASARVVQTIDGNADTEGTALVSLAGLADAVRRMPSDTIRLHTTASRLVVSSGYATVSLALSTDELPQASADVSGGLTVKTTAGALESALARVLFCVSTDDSRYGLNGVSVSVEGESLRLAGTDGHRASKSYLSADVSGSVGSVMLSRDGAGLILAAMAQCGTEDSVELQLAPAWSSLRIEGATVFFLGLEGEFPDLSAVWPSRDKGMVVKFDRALMLEAVAIADVSRAEQGANTTMWFEVDVGSVDLSMTGVERSSSTSAPVVSVDGPVHKFGLAPAYLTQALKHCAGDVVTIHHGHALGPLLIVDDSDGSMVIMPRRD